MPIDYKRYPPNWLTEIRPKILEQDVMHFESTALPELPTSNLATLERDGHRCARCGLRNGAIGHRDREGVWLGECGVCLSTAPCDEPRPVRIVLTIAHLHNDDPMDVRDDNLAALCQQCHNRLDAPMRAARAAETRRHRKAERGQGALL